MKKEIVIKEKQLPTNIKDLQQFILVAREALKMYRIKLHAVNNLNVAKSIREQTLQDGQKVGTALLYAETKLGELLKDTVKAGGKSNRTSRGGSSKPLPEGISWKQSHIAQQLAEHKDLIEETVKEAEKNEDIPTKTEVLRKIKEEGREQKIIKQRERKIDIPKDIKIILKQGDFRILIKDLPDNSIDLILTDPPYSKEFLPLWKDLAKEAKRILKPSGFLISYSGQAYLLKVLNILSEHLEYYWLGMLYHKGPTRQIFSVNMWNRSKPILFFYKPPLKKQKNWLEDVIISEEPNKDIHEWGQNIGPFKKLIECFTEPNEIILDPMFGGGSIIEACIETKRNVYGFEINKKYFNLINDKTRINL